MKAAKRASGWYCQSRPDVHTHIYPPHILAPSTCSVELSLYFRCIGTTLVWPLCLPARPSIDWWPLTSTHCTLPPSSKALCIHYSPFVMHSYTHSLSLFLAFLRMQTHEHILFLPLIPPPHHLRFSGSYCSLWCNCASAPCCFPTVSPHWRPPLYPGELSLPNPTLNAGYYTS